MLALVEQGLALALLLAELCALVLVLLVLLDHLLLDALQPALGMRVHYLYEVERLQDDLRHLQHASRYQSPFRCALLKPLSRLQGFGFRA